MGWFDKLTTSGQQPKPLVLSLSKDPLRDGLIAELISTDRLMGNDKFRKGGQESPPLAKACPEPAEWGDLGGFSSFYKPVMSWVETYRHAVPLLKGAYLQ